MKVSEEEGVFECDTRPETIIKSNDASVYMQERERGALCMPDHEVLL